MSISSTEDLRGMQAAGHVVATTIEAMRASVHIGMTTAQMDKVAADVFKKLGARSAPQVAYNFPGVTCISVNDEIVHGIPGARRLAPKPDQAQSRALSADDGWTIRTKNGALAVHEEHTVVIREGEPMILTSA